MKETLAVGIVFLFLSTSCFPFVTANNEKPDLIIEDIFLVEDHEPLSESLHCTVRNIGNTPVPSGVDYEVDVRIYLLLFRIIPVIPIKSYTRHIIIHGSLFGEDTVDIYIEPFYEHMWEIPIIWGAYRFCLTVNPNKLIDESNFDNNKYGENWFRTIMYWYPLN